MKIDVLLQPGCENFIEKLSLFAIAEGWEDLQLNNKQKNLLFKIVDYAQQRYSKQYFHSLFHILTCPFCLEHAPKILKPRSHEQLWKLTSHHPGEYWEIIRQINKKPLTTSLYYFKLLYDNLLNIDSLGVLVNFLDKENSKKAVYKAHAAGVPEEIPSSITPLQNTFFYEQNISLHFERDPIDLSLNIDLKGANAQIRSAIKIKVYFYNGEQQTFAGKEIAMGGTWSIKAEKAKNICCIDFIC